MKPNSPPMYERVLSSLVYCLSMFNERLDLRKLMLAKSVPNLREAMYCPTLLTTPPYEVLTLLKGRISSSVFMVYLETKILTYPP